jgi:RHS repeat-associated protein
MPPWTKRRGYRDADVHLTIYRWGIENHLTVVQSPAGTRTAATYDGGGKRRNYADSVILRNFLWDGENIARQTDVNGATNRNYTLNPQAYGELISQDGPAFHHYDALGSTRTLTDGSQTVTDTRDYRAFGATNASSGTNVNRFWWVGRLGYYFQPDTQDHWVRARVYRPQMGRWVNRDPYRRLRTEAYAEYAYGPNDPVSGRDP